MNSIFEFATASRIIFGEGAAKQLPAAAKQWCRRVLLVTGRNPERWKIPHNELEGAGLSVSIFAVSGEPTIHLIAQGVQQAREEKCDVVVSIGGGSVIDAGKAIAGLHTNPGEVLDYLEVVGKGQPPQNPAAPF